MMVAFDSGLILGLLQITTVTLTQLMNAAMAC